MSCGSGAKASSSRSGAKASSSRSAENTSAAAHADYKKLVELHFRQIAPWPFNVMNLFCGTIKVDFAYLSIGFLTWFCCW